MGAVPIAPDKPNIEGENIVVDSCGKDCYTNGKGCVLTTSGICVFKIAEVKARHYSTRTFYDPKNDPEKIRQERIKKIVAERKPLKRPNIRISQDLSKD